MAMHSNGAAVDSMKTLQSEVTAELVKRFEAAGLDPKLIDDWTDQIISNSAELESVSEPDVPVYRISGVRDRSERSRSTRPAGL